MWPGDLAPDDPDLGSPLLSLSLVDVCDLLAQVEAVVVLLVVCHRKRDCETGCLGLKRTWQQQCHQHPRS